MDEQELKDEQRESEFRTKLEELMQEYVDVTGLRYFNEEGEKLPDSEQHYDQMMPGEWVLVSSWHDLSNGFTRIRGITQKNMLKHHQLGMLYEMMNMIEEYG